MTLSSSRWIAIIAAIALAVPLFAMFGLYRAIFRFSGGAARDSIIAACSVYAILYFTFVTAIGLPDVPRSVGIVQPILMFLSVSITRFLVGFALGGQYRHILEKSSRRKAVIYGAGGSGRQTAAALASGGDLQVVAFLDDDPALQNNSVHGLRIHAPEKLPELIAERGVTDLLLAIPSASRRRRNEIIESLRSAAVAVRTLPSVSDLVEGNVEISDLRELDVEDILGRETVPPDDELIGLKIAGKAVMVTGAGGSIGSELARQIARLGPEVLLLIDQSESSLHAIHQELLKRTPGTEKPLPRIVPLLGSVCDHTRMGEIIAAWRPDTIYHAAAYKHVPMVEHNPGEGIRNNVFGTLALAELAEAHGVADFVLISTDKAVRPTNVMGATKRLAETILQGLAAAGGRTRFSMVRFGNVLGSSGSVVPHFRQQIRHGGPVTVTHPEMTRYFMTIPEAAQLVIQAGAMAQGGEVFVLDMGQPVRISDLARKMVELSGLSVRDEANPGGDIEIVFVGPRPGEKLSEELLIGDDPIGTDHPGIMKAREHCPPWSETRRRLRELDQLLSDTDISGVSALLREMVPEYQPEDQLMDFVRQRQAGELAVSPAERRLAG